MDCSSAIGIFDSGVGGISVANAISQQLPNENLVYIADSRNAPFGDKSASFIFDRCRYIVDFLLARNVKMVVVACNTATLSCIDELRKHYDIPFVGVEPGIKPAIKASKTGIVGVLATQGSLSSIKYQKLVASIAAEHQVINQPCVGLVELIEGLQFNSQQTLDLLNKYIEPLLARNVDQLVLGCTHYPFVYTQIDSIVNGRAEIIDTSKSVASQVTNIASRIGLNIEPKRQTEVFSSLLSDSMREKITRLWHSPPISINYLS